MKYLARFLLAVLCVVPFGAQGSNVPTTRGNNLTAYNGASGSTNNNNWNALMNVRSGSDAADMPVADFGNCNAIVLRCAQPKCANGGCTDMNIAATIVNGCVQSNEACKEYGDDLIGYIAAQLVANSTAKANAAQAAAAQNAAAQSAQQMAQMQAQMQQMQSEMAAQNAETVAQLQSALEEQKQLTAQAIADATASRSAPVATVTTSSSNNDLTTQQQAAAGALTTAQQIAAQNGVSPDLLAREQNTGQIMSSLENAETQLKTLKTTMADTFEYAGCDTKGSNCTGPKRVKVFKQKAMSFFDPYENVLDELYDALITAQAVGVDITDIYMMLNGSCNVWGKYLCNLGATIKEKVCDDVTSTTGADGKTTTTESCHYVTLVRNTTTYDANTCPDNTRSVLVSGMRARGGHECIQGQVIPPEDDIACTLQKMIIDNNDDDPVQRDWLWNETDEEGSNIRIGCASSALESSKFFRNRKKGTNLDIEILERIIEQDAPSSYGALWRNSGKVTQPDPDGIKYCAVNDNTLADLEKIVSLKTLPSTICVPDNKLENILSNGGVLSKGYRSLTRYEELVEKCQDWTKLNTRFGVKYTSYMECLCEEGGEGLSTYYNDDSCGCVPGMKWNAATLRCEDEPIGI